MAKPLMIAIGGGSGSGKTTVVRLLERHLRAEGVLIVSQDHYYLDLSHLKPEERDRRNFDHPEALDFGLIRQQMHALASGQSVERPTYDFASHTRKPATELLDPQPIIFFDGILSLTDEKVRSYFDVCLYVDVPSDIRFIRRLQRDVAERGRTVKNVCQQYLETVRPMHEKFVEPTKQFADIVIEWIIRDEDKITKLAGDLRSRLSKRNAS